MHKIGYINACIAGDHRYSSRVVVLLDTLTGEVEIVRQENGAIGGMDGPGGSYDFTTVKGVTLCRKDGEPTAKFASRVVKATKSVFDHVIKNYGKPSKRFEWMLCNRHTLSGLSVAKVTTTLQTYGV